MEFITEAINFMSLGVKIFGAATAIMGVIDYGEGKSKKQSAQKDEGVEKIMGGGIVFLVGQLLIPKLASLFTI